MTPTRRTIATLATAVLSVPCALGMGGLIGDTIRDAGTTVTHHEHSDEVFTLPTPEGKHIGKTVGASLDYLSTPDDVDCFPLVMADGVDYSHLTSSGWHGDPTDGSDVLLYAPGC